MDDLTRHFIATSKSLRYLAYEQEQESLTETQKGDSQGKIEKPCTDSAGRKQDPKVNETDSSGDRSKDAISDYVSNLKKNFDKVKDDPKFIVEVVGIIAALAVIIIYVCQLHQMSEQSGAMKHQLEMADRPWIKDTVRSNSDFMANNGAFSWAVTIRAENVGHSVATAIYPQTKLIAIQGADFIDAPRRKARELCDEVSARFEKVKDDPVVWSNAIFPGDWSEFASSPILWPAEINSATTFHGGAKVGESFIPMLIGCVEYHYATSEKPHKTWFVYTLSHSDNLTIPLPTRTFFSLGKTVPSANMLLIKADQFAD